MPECSAKLIVVANKASLGCIQSAYAIQMVGFQTYPEDELEATPLLTIQNVVWNSQGP